MTLDTTTEPINPVSERRTVPLRIGTTTYTARCPKLKVWLDAAMILEQQQATAAANRAERRAADRDGDAAAAGEGTISRSQLTVVLGAFLRGCLTRQDAAAVDAELDDPETDLDVPDLWRASLGLLKEFEPDMRERAKQMGLKVPGSINALTAEPAPTRARRTPQDRKPARKAAAPRKTAARG